MAGSQPEISSSKNSKEKKSMLDEEFGQEFLSSWKSMSVVEDDSLDFGFNTASTGKKKAFNFGKLDMDFDLGDDFDKFSSFKVDMPDLDFTSPAPKAVTTKETSAGSSGATSQKKRDTIFSFDFNELDNFKFDSAITVDGEKPTKNINKNAVNSDHSDCQETQDSTFKQRGKNEVADNDQRWKLNLPDNDQRWKLNLPVADNGTASFVEAAAAGEETTNFSDNAPAVRTFGDSIVSHEEAPEKTIMVIDQLSDSSNETMQGEINGRQTSCIVSTQPGSGEDFNVRTGLCAQTKDLSCDAETGPHHNIADETAKVSCPRGVNSPQKNSNTSMSVTEEHNESEGARTGYPMEQNVETEPLPNDINFGSSSTASLSCGDEIKKDVQTSGPKCLGQLGIEAAGNSVITGQKRESTVTAAKDLKIEKETERQVCQKPLSDVEFSPLGKEGAAALNMSSPTNERDSKPIGRSLVGNSNTTSQKMPMQLAFSEKEKNAIILGNMREALNADGLQKGCRLVDNLRISDKVNKGNALVLGGTKSIKPLLLESSEKSPASSVDNPNKLNHKTSASSSIGISRIGWNPNSKVITVEGPKTLKTTPDLFNLKISGTSETIKDQSSFSPKSESMLSRSCKIKEGQANALLTSLYPVVSSERKTLASMKRKISEASQEDAEAFNSSKRLSPSPSESSNFKKPTSSNVENQVCSQDNQGGNKTKNYLYDHPTSSWGTPGVNVKELEITSDFGDDGNVEKAEAYAKELEDICCMLKKKHEEAKELLVRAIVNNNSLLMLNHPMLDEKVHIQLFGYDFHEDYLLPSDERSTFKISMSWQMLQKSPSSLAL